MLPTIAVGQMVVVPTALLAPTGDPKVGLETGNRTPPAYGIDANRSLQLAPTAMGSEVHFRSVLSQATSQAYRSFLPTNALAVSKEE